MGKQERIKAILDNAVKELEREGVKFFLSAVDKQPGTPPHGGQAYAVGSITGEDFIHVLDLALPRVEDVSLLGIYVGKLLIARKGHKKKHTG